MSAAKAAYCLTVPAQRLSDVATYLQERASDEPGQTLDGLGPELATLEASCDELESTLANFRVPFERLDEMSLDHIVLEPTIDHLVKRMQERAKSSGVELVIDIDLGLDETTAIYADKNALEQVIDFVFTNALEFNYEQPVHLKIASSSDHEATWSLKSKGVVILL